MSDRLDRLEKIVESNAKAIESLASQAVEYRREAAESNQQLNDKLDRLANIVLRIHNR
jgi:uncharacterized coiled-coil protein SlyX